MLQELLRSQKAGIRLLISLSMGLIFSFALPCFGASSPASSNPIFQALLASLLETEKRTEAQSIERFDAFLKMLLLTVDSRTERNVVWDFPAYLALRNQVYDSPESAFKAYSQKGIVTPFSVRAANSQVMEQMMIYETQEMKSFLEYLKQEMKADSKVINLHHPIWNLLPDLFLIGKSFHDSLDAGSADAIRQSFEASNQMRKNGNPAGIFAFTLGIGLSAARAVGETVVNPLAQSIIYSETLQDKVKLKAKEEILKILSWPQSKKIQLIGEFQSSIDAAISEQIKVASRMPELERLSQEIPAVEILRRDFLLAYFKNLSQLQKSNLVWAVLVIRTFQK